MACPKNLGDCLILQNNSTVNSTYPDSATLINNVLPNVYVASGVVIFIMILVGGFMIISNAGNRDKVADGGKIITSAIIGLLVIFASYWIIQLIQVVTGLKIL